MKRKMARGIEPLPQRVKNEKERRRRRRRAGVVLGRQEGGGQKVDDGSGGGSAERNNVQACVCVWICLATPLLFC